MQLLFLPLIVLIAGSFGACFYLLYLNNKKNKVVVGNLQKELDHKKYETFLLGEIGDRAGTSLDIIRIGEILIGSLESVLNYQTSSYLLLTSENKLLFKCYVRETVGQIFVAGVKKRMLDSLGLILQKDFSRVVIDEATAGKLIDDVNISQVMSYFTIPLILANRPIGVLTIASSKHGLYTAEETTLFYTTTKRVLVAVSRMQSIIEQEKISREKKEKEAERRAYQAEVLRELEERVGYSLDLNKTIEIISGSIGRLLQYHTISYMIKVKDRIIFKCNIQESINRNFVSDVKNKMLQAFSAMLNIQLKPEDVDESITGSIFNEDIKDPVGSFFNLPLIINQNVVGLINVASPKVGLYTEEETSILYTITAQASASVTKLTEVLEREKGKLNALVASLDDGIVMVDPYWNLLVANTQACKMLNLTEGDITMLDVLDKLSGKIDIRTKIEEAVVKRTEIAPSEIAMGAQILQVITLQVKGKDQENLGAVVVFHDITHEKEEKNIIEKKVEERTRQLAEEQSRFIAAINSVPRGFIIVDPHGNIIVTNNVLATILGKEEKGWTLQAIHDKLKPASFDLIGNYSRCLTEKKALEEISLTLGSKFLRIYLAPILLEGSTDNIIGVVILIDDVTEAKVMERSKDEFFSIASHELRTPLTAIKGNTSLIQQYYLDKIQDQDLKDMITDIHDSSIRLIEIVNDFLNMSRLEQGKMEFKKEQFDMVVLIQSTVKELSTIAEEKKIAIAFTNTSVLPPAFADKDKIKEVLMNLVGNAMKFTEKGGITITVSSEGNILRVAVTDTGKGIPLESQSLLFRKFQQASNNILTRDTTRSTGLGLYISKLMIEGMGGIIYLQSSQENVGSTFAFTVPVATTLPQSPKTTLPSVPLPQQPVNTQNQA